MTPPLRPLASRLILAGLLLGAACHDPTPAARRNSHARQASGDIVIGAAWPWTAQKDVQYWEGLALAAEEVNDAGGIAGRHLRLLKADDHESVNDGLRVAQAFAGNPDVVAVIGHLQSYVSVPAAAVYDAAGLVMLAPASTDPELTARGYTRVFRGTFTDLQQGFQLAELARASGYRRIAIIYIRNTYGRGVANSFEEHATELGLNIVARQGYDPDAPAEQAFDAVLTDWHGLQFDAMLVAGEVPTAAEFIVQARRHGISAPVLGGDAMSSPALITVGGSAVEGAVVLSSFHPEDPRARTQTFVRAFRTRYGRMPDAGAALGYDAVGLLADAMRRASAITPDQIAKALHATTDWEGVTGRFAFDEHGELVPRPIVRMMVHHGRFEVLPPEPGAVAVR
jgi:branched-chain amino acid transport system substrate-binding protein